MDDYKLLIDLHKQDYRQVPGGDAETEQALNLAMMDGAAPLKVADIAGAARGHPPYCLPGS